MPWKQSIGWPLPVASVSVDRASEEFNSFDLPNGKVRF